MANSRAGAVILMHHHGDVGEFFHGRQNQMTQERRTGVFAGTGGGLHDHRAVGLISRFHDGAHLFQIVYVECGHAVALFGGVVQQLSHTDESHDPVPRFGSCVLKVVFSIVAGTGTDFRTATSTSLCARQRPSMAADVRKSVPVPALQYAVPISYLPRSCNMATAGSTLPSTYSRKAPPPVEI